MMAEVKQKEENEIELLTTESNHAKEISNDGSMHAERQEIVSVENQNQVLALFRIRNKFLKNHNMNILNLLFSCIA